MILARYEADCEQDRPGLVGDALSYIWAAREGLSEPQLLALCRLRSVVVPDVFNQAVDLSFTRVDVGRLIGAWQEGRSPVLISLDR